MRKLNYKTRQRIKSAKESAERVNYIVNGLLALAGDDMIKHEPTIQQLFDDWRLQKFPYNFSHALFDAINRANLQETELLRLGFPEHVRIFEEYYAR